MKVRIDPGITGEPYETEFEIRRIEAIPRQQMTVINLRTGKFADYPIHGIREIECDNDLDIWLQVSFVKSLIHPN